MDEGIPHLVKMHEKYGKDGLVILTVNMDENKDKDTTAEDRAGWRKTIQRYLLKRTLPFRTYDLEFDPNQTPAPLKFYAGVPRVFVCNRDGQYAFREGGPDEKDVEKAIAEAVKKK